VGQGIPGIEGGSGDGLVNHVVLDARLVGVLLVVDAAGRLVGQPHVKDADRHQLGDGLGDDRPGHAVGQVEVGGLLRFGDEPRLLLQLVLEIAVETLQVGAGKALVGAHLGRVAVPLAR